MKIIPDSIAPQLEVNQTGGGQWRLSDQKPENFLMIIFYRGLHCPICKNYLEDLEPLLDTARKKGVEVFALSGDNRERAHESASDWDIGDLKLGYGLTLAQMQEWGLYISNAIKEEEPSTFSEPALFLIRPDRTVYYAAYNSMPMGRPDVKEVLEFVDFALEEGYPARGEKTEGSRGDK
ncbi:MAG: peroxiredoxin-like family protein [Verrucomicrobiales bacterium]|nr:peroxiredoxin-like family protein [Verrucomicrobiales bacterium]